MAKRDQAELQDLSSELQEVTLSKEGCFYKYRGKGEIGQKIYEELLKKYNEDGGFVFSDELTEIGLLSQLQGLSSVVELLENFDLNAKDKKVRSFLDGLIDYMLGEVYVDGQIRIGASPYRVDDQLIGYDYIDSVTWVVSALLGIMRLHIKGDYLIDFESEKGKKISELYIYCLNYLLDSYIDEPTSKRKFNCGWNFTKDCEEPSLYFTFAVSELLIDILDTFEDVIRVADIELIKTSIVESLDKTGFLNSSRFRENLDRVNNALDRADADEGSADYISALAIIPEFSDDEKELIKAVREKVKFVEQEYAGHKERLERNRDEARRQVELFSLVNDRKAVYDARSPYARFEMLCKKSANQIWELTKDGLASEFYSANLEAKITEEMIASSVSSDAIFNVIFVINILINAGIDEDYEDRINYFTENDSNSYYEAQAEYDNMRDTLRLAYDNCYQYLAKLKKENKEYKIAEYNLNFDEVFVEHAKIIKDIRKEHIRVFSLMPLMVRTKTTIGEFLIKYPQYDMMIYLEHILKYRCINKQDLSYRWIWENDGYSASSNYYFISALGAFYEYYNKYEYIFHSNVNKNAKAKKKIEEEYHRGLQEAGWAIDRTDAEFAELEAQNQQKEEQLLLLQAKIDYFENDPLRKALNDFVEATIRQSIISVLTTALQDEAGRIITDAGARVKQSAADIEAERQEDKIDLETWKSTSDKGNSFEKSIRSIVLASLAAEQLGETIYSTKLTKEERIEALDDLDKYVRRLDRDTKKAVRYHVQGIADGKDTAYVANKGESTLPIAKHVKLMEMLDKKSDKGDED